MFRIGQKQMVKLLDMEVVPVGLECILHRMKKRQKKRERRCSKYVQELVFHR